MIFKNQDIMQGRQKHQNGEKNIKNFITFFIKLLDKVLKVCYNIGVKIRNTTNNTQKNKKRGIYYETSK